MSESLADVAAPPKRRPGRPRAQVQRPMVSLRLDPDVLQGLRALGPGWQTRVNAWLRQVVELSGYQSNTLSASSTALVDSASNTKSDLRSL